MKKIFKEEIGDSIIIIVVDLEEIGDMPEFEEYFIFRERHPEIDPKKLKNKFGDLAFHFELAYNMLYDTDET